MLLVFTVAIAAVLALALAATFAGVLSLFRGRTDAAARRLARFAKWTWITAGACAAIVGTSLVHALWRTAHWQQRADFLSPNGAIRAHVYTQHQWFLFKYELHCRLLLTDVASGDLITNRRVQEAPLVDYFWDCPDFHFTWRADQKGGELRYRVPPHREDITLSVP